MRNEGATRSEGEREKDPAARTGRCRAGVWIALGPCLFGLTMPDVLLASVPVSAQDRALAGVVVDAEDGEPLQGVTVRIERTELGVITRPDGTFRIEGVPAGTRRVVAERVGFQTVERNVRIAETGTTEIRVRLSTRAVKLGDIQVIGRRGDYSRPVATTPLKVPTSQMNTAQSVSVVSDQVIHEQQAFTLNEVLENVSGVGTTDGFGQTLDGFRLRGFFSRDVFIDGIPETGANPIKQDVATIERVEVLKGPASAAFGRTQPGGLVNIVTKRPQRIPSQTFEATGGESDGFFRGLVDLTGPLTDDGSVRYRLIGAVERDDSFRDFIDGEDVVVAPSLAVDFTDRIGLTVDFEWQHSTLPIDRGIPAVDGGPADVDESFSMSGPQPSRTANEWRGRYELSFEATDHLTLFQRSRLAWSDNEFVNVQPIGIEGRTIQRQTNKNDNEENTQLVQLEAVYDRSAFGIGHTVLGGVEYRREDFGFDFRLADTPDLDIDDPDFAFDPEFPEVRTGGGDFPTETYSVYLQDHIQLTDGLSVLLGGRVDRAEVESSFEFQGNLSEQTTETTEFTPRAGIVYRPIEHVAVFGNFAESFSPQNGRDSEGNPFDPEEGRQFEGGVKLETRGGRLQTTLAFFDIEKQNVAVADPDVPGASILTGEEESTGFEFDLIGGVTDNWQFIANYSYKDSEISEETDPELLGKRLPNVARHRGRIWTRYRVPGGALRNLKLGAGVTAVGERFGDRLNTVTLPDYGRVDASVSYTLPGYRGLEATLQVKNVFDEDIFTSGVSFGARNIQVGDTRSLVGTLRFRP